MSYFFWVQFFNGCKWINFGGCKLLKPIKRKKVQAEMKVPVFLKSTFKRPPRKNFNNFYQIVKQATFFFNKNVKFLFERHREKLHYKD